MKDVKSHENKSIENRLKELTQNIDFEKHNLDIVTGDWAPWDDTYYFIKDGNKNYEKQNLNSETLQNLKINLFLLYDNKNQLIESKVMNSGNNFVNIDRSQTEDIEKYGSVFFNLNKLTEGASGFIIFNGKPMLISSRPVTNSILSQPKIGTLIMGRFLDNTMMSKFQSLSDSKIYVIPAASPQIPDEVKDDLKNSSYDAKPVNDNQIYIYKPVEDPLGNVIYYFKIVQDRQLYLQGLESIRFYIVFLSISFFILFLLVLFLINKNILKPVENISHQVRGIVLDDYEKGIITAKGKDEFSFLAKDINSMLSRIHLFNKKIKENEERLKMVLDGSNSGYWEYDAENNILYPSEKIMEILGYKSAEQSMINIKELKKRIHKDEYTYACSMFEKILLNLSSNITLECRVLTGSNSYKWLFIQGNIVEYKNGLPKKILGIVMDIDHRKSIENEIKYLTYYDKLTGLFNRGYYEFSIENIENRGIYPYSVIIGDINGLKITNDTFGHTAGDILIQETAKLLKNSCPEGATICRWGGDEFIIVLQNCSEKQADDVCSKIKGNINKEAKYIVSIALGYASKNSPSQNINNLIKQAEERMYHNKILENKSFRNNTLSLLSRTLFEKSHETKEHADRIYYLCEKISAKLNLSSIMLNELSLVAKLHDIGKIGISDKILNKPEKLSPEEWDIMKTHTQIGYRIATSVPDLQHVAYEILCHHERYDGRGYPNGLKGESIPLISRILSIVDSFDVMTHDRPYKKAMSIENAVEELRRCSSYQFDPKLVKTFLEVILESQIS